MSTIQRPSSSSRAEKYETSTLYPNTSESVRRQAVEVLHLITDILLLFIKFWWFVGEATFRLFAPVPEKCIKNEIVVITGTGHGIGRELALQYASAGATVVCWDINKKGNLETVQEIAKLGYPKAYSYECNVANREQVMETAKRVQREVGEVTILINNAGIMPCHSFMDHTVDEIERIMNINVMAHYWTLKAFLPSMLKNNHGHIVAMASIAGLMGIRNLVPYCASKYAVRGMMEALHQDLHADPKCNIKLTTICPYGVNTGLCKKPKFRFPKMFALLSPKKVAKYIISAQRRDIFETTIPRNWLSLIYYSRLLPPKTLILINDFFDSYLDSDL